MPNRTVPLAALLGLLLTSPAQAGEVSLSLDENQASFNQIVAQRIRPQIDLDARQRLIAEGRDMQIDGQRVFTGNDKFLPGKIALAFGDVITITAGGRPAPREIPARLRAHRGSHGRRPQRQLGHLLLPVGAECPAASGPAAGDAGPSDAGQAARAAGLAQFRGRERLHAHRSPQQLLLRGFRHRAAAACAGLGRRHGCATPVHRDDGALRKVFR